jgi:hypothetical protein
MRPRPRSGRQCFLLLLLLLFYACFRPVWGATFGLRRGRLAQLPCTGAARGRAQLSAEASNSSLIRRQLRLHAGRRKKNPDSRPDRERDSSCWRGHFGNIREGREWAAKVGDGVVWAAPALRRNPPRRTGQPRPRKGPASGTRNSRLPTAACWPAGPPSRRVLLAKIIAGFVSSLPCCSGGSRSDAVSLANNEHSSRHGANDGASRLLRRRSLPTRNPHTRRTLARAHIRTAFLGHDDRTNGLWHRRLRR